MLRYAEIELKVNQKLFTDLYLKWTKKITSTKKRIATFGDTPTHPEIHSVKDIYSTIQQKLTKLPTAV